MRRAKRLQAGAALGAAAWGVLFLAGCAAQAPPRPPRLQRPEVVTDLAVKQVGTSVEVSFTPPSDAVDGETLTKPLEIEIDRAIAPAGQAAAGATPLATLDSQDLARHMAAGKALYRDAVPPAEFGAVVGRRFQYSVHGFTRGFRGRAIEGEPSRPATITLLDVPRAPVDVAVQASQNALRVRWSAAAETASGRAAGFAMSYHVYRGVAGPRGPFRLLGVAHETSFDDSSFEFGHAYVYRVRAVVNEGGESAESDDSAAVEITPRDTFSPAAPAGLTALFTTGAVELVWSPNLEPDLAGYNVYRGEGRGTALKLNPDLLRTPLYRDATVTAGQRYTYRVTAVDRSGNESAPSAEAAVEAQ